MDHKQGGRLNEAMLLTCLSFGLDGAFGGLDSRAGRRFF